MTDAEFKKSNYNDPCPKCGEKNTYIIGGAYGSHSGCHDCHHEWGWSDARGSSVSHAKFKERAESVVAEMRSKSAKSWRMDAPAGEESDMAKKKVAKKKGARGGKTTTTKMTKAASGSGKKLTVVAHVLEMLRKNPKLTADQFVVGVRKQFPKSIQRPEYFGGYVKMAIERGIIKASDRAKK